jgi:hypothetical protein
MGLSSLTSEEMVLPFEATIGEDPTLSPFSSSGSEASLEHTYLEDDTLLSISIGTISLECRWKKQLIVAGKSGE